MAYIGIAPRVDGKAEVLDTGDRKCKSGKKVLEVHLHRAMEQQIVELGR